MSHSSPHSTPGGSQRPHSLSEPPSPHGSRPRPPSPHAAPPPVTCPSPAAAAPRSNGGPASQGGPGAERWQRRGGTSRAGTAPGSGERHDASRGAAAAGRLDGEPGGAGGAGRGVAAAGAAGAVPEAAGLRECGRGPGRGAGAAGRWAHGSPFSPPDRCGGHPHRPQPLPAPAAVRQRGEWSAPHWEPLPWVAGSSPLPSSRPPCFFPTRRSPSSTGATMRARCLHTSSPWPTGPTTPCWAAGEPVRRASASSSGEARAPTQPSRARRSPAQVGDTSREQLTGARVLPPGSGSSCPIRIWYEAHPESFW